jgi:hypothetical protein
MPTMIERRIAGVEAALAEISPPPSRYDEFIMENPWIEWATWDELVELEQICHEAEEAEWTPSAEARAMAIALTAEARRLAGEPKDSDLPRPAYDVQAEYVRSRR